MSFARYSYRILLKNVDHITVTVGYILPQRKSRSFLPYRSLSSDQHSFDRFAKSLFPTLKNIEDGHVMNHPRQSRGFGVLDM